MAAEPGTLRKLLPRDPWPGSARKLPSRARKQAVSFFRRFILFGVDNFSGLEPPRKTRRINPRKHGNGPDQQQRAPQ
jgi:hypothetical protein